MTPLPDPLRTLRRRWPTLLLGAVVGAAVGVGVPHTLGQSWTATAVVQVIGPPSAAANGPNASSRTSEDFGRIVATEQRLVLGDAVVTQVAGALHETSAAVRAHASVTGGDTADTLDIVGTGSTAQAAQQAAQQVASTYVSVSTASARNATTDTLGRLDTQIAQLQAKMLPSLSADTLQPLRSQLDVLTQQRAGFAAGLDAFSPPVLLVSAAALPTSPTSPPGAGKTGPIGLLLGLVIAGAVILLRASRSDVRVPTRGIAEATGLRLLGAIPYVPAIRRGSTPAQLLAGGADLPLRDAAGELLAVLQAHAAAGDRPLHVVLVTSPSRYDGKSTVAASLAAAAGAAGQRVLLVGADVRAPSSAAFPSAEDRTGLTEAVAAAQVSTPVTAWLTAPTGPPGVRVLPVGRLRGQGLDLLRSAAAPQALRALAAGADLCVVDAPSVSAPETLVLAAVADTVLLSVGSHASWRSTLLDAGVVLAAAGIIPAGVVVVDTDGSAALGAADYTADPTPRDAPVLPAAMPPVPTGAAPPAPAPGTPPPAPRDELADDLLGSEQSTRR